MSSFNKVFNLEEQARLKQLIKEGGQVHYEIDSLKEGLSETVKAVAEEMDIKPALLNKAIRVAHKASFTDERENFDALETILETVGQTL